MSRTEFVSGNINFNTYSQCDAEGTLTWTHVGRDFANSDVNVRDMHVDITIPKGFATEIAVMDCRAQAGEVVCAVQNVRLKVTSVKNCENPNPYISIEANVGTSVFRFKAPQKYSVDYTPVMRFTLDPGKNVNTFLGRFTPNLEPGSGYKYRLKRNDDRDPLCRTLLLDERWPVPAGTGDVFQYDMPLTINGYQQTPGEHTCSLTLSIDEP
ncbi:hypothetical protein D3C73_832320 [compost metagenome]